MKKQPMDKEQLKAKIRELSVEFEDKKQLIEVLTRVEADLNNDVTEREKELKTLRPLQVQKEKELTELEERKKKQERRLEELRLTIIQNSEELQKLKLQDEQIARSTFEAQEKEKILKQELKRKDMTEYVPTIQKLARLEQELLDSEKKAKAAEDNFNRLTEDVRALTSQVNMLTQAASKMTIELKSKDKVIEELERDIEAKRNERYASDAEIEKLKSRMTSLQNQRDELEDKEEKFRQQCEEECMFH